MAVSCHVRQRRSRDTNNSTTQTPYWRGSLPGMGGGQHINSQLCKSQLSACHRGQSEKVFSISHEGSGDRAPGPGFVTW